MKPLAFRGDPTRLLWFATGVSVLALGLALVYRLAPLLPGSADGLTEIQPIGKLDSVAPNIQPAAVVARNPFDAGGTHWGQAAKGVESPGAGTGAIKGVFLLPGARAVLTEGRTVKFGEALEGGKLLAVEGDQLIIQTSEGRKRIDLPGASRPHLKDLNRP